MWDHVRGNDVDEDGPLKMGRKGWFDEVMRFYDRYLAPSARTRAAAADDPTIAVQTSDGSARACGRSHRR